MNYLILAAMMATNSFTHSGTNTTLILSSEASNQYTFNGNSIRDGSVLNIGSTNVVLRTDLKPVVTQSNGVYWIRFEVKK